MSQRLHPSRVDQLALPFGHTPVYGPDFLADESNADAIAWLARTDWPQARLALWGAPGVGKTHLLRAWATRTGASVLDGAGLRFEPVLAPLAIDDANRAPEEPLLHMLNAATEAGRAVLLAAREPPARWMVALPDLASRLRTIVSVRIDEPNDMLLCALLARLLSERQLAVPQALQDYLLLRLPRTAGAIREATLRIDQTCFKAGKAPSRAMMKDIAEALAAPSGGSSVEMDEEFAAAGLPVSPGEPQAV